MVEGCKFNWKYENVMNEDIAECWKGYGESTGQSMGALHSRWSNLKVFVNSNQWFQPDVYVCRVRCLTENIIESLTFVNIVWYVDNKDFAGDVIVVYTVSRLSKKLKIVN